jgi:outer membrane protein OmpA-like peptidoglycan-associated protein
MREKETVLMIIRHTPALLGVLTVLSLATIGCATKKHVREAIAPVQNQVNQTQSQVTTLQKQTDENKQSIGDLDRQVATADEKAVEAGKRAAEAAESAAKANSAALEAAQRADAANNAVQQTNQKLDTSLNNLDNYKLATTLQVHFGINRSILAKDEREKLDAAVGKFGEMKNFVVEVEGYADRTGSPVANRELSQKRADAVVHYLAVEHNVPLRSIRVLGVGSDFPDADNKTRAARKENRRVDVKIYSLDLSGQATPTQSLNSKPAGQ